MNDAYGQRTFLNLFPPPEFLMLSTAGIVINDYDTRFVELRREMLGDGFRLLHSSQTANAERAVSSGLVSDASAITPILRELADRYSIRYTHATLPDERSYLFTATIDRVPNDGLRDVVAFIVEENAPVSLAESVFDFLIIGEDVEANKLKVAVSVLSKEVVNSYIALFESSGITPISFDIESQAIARSIIRKGDPNSYLIVNLAHHKTGFYVVERGVVHFSTTSAYRIDKISQSDSPSELSELRSEMTKVLDFWGTHNPTSGELVKKIEKAIICGYGANRKDLIEQLMNGSGLTHELADAWSNLSLSSRSRVSAETLEQSLDYATAIGAALSGRKIKHV